MRTSEPNRERFHTTQWTRVLQARGQSEDAQTALSELCEAYYAPVHAFIRRTVNDGEKSRDLTQEFFARLLKRHSLGNADPNRGRFRNYLLTSVKNFLNDQHDAQSAAKRNPGSSLQSIHPDTNSTTHPGLQIPDPQSPAPDLDFDRKWALALLDRALTALAEEMKSEGKQQTFETLKPWLTGDTQNHPQSQAAADLASTEANVKVAIHRLRRRFRNLVKEQIAATLPEPNPAQIADELSYLVSILR